MREDQLFVPVYQIVMVASISPLICHSFIYNYPISKNSLAVLWIECLNALYIFFNRYNRISTHEYNNFFIIMLRYQFWRNQNLNFKYFIQLQYHYSLVAAISLLIYHSFKYNDPISMNSLAVLWIECRSTRILSYLFFNGYDRISTYEYINFSYRILKYQLISVFVEFEL